MLDASVKMWEGGRTRRGFGLMECFQIYPGCYCTPPKPTQFPAHEPIDYEPTEVCIW